MGTSNERAAAVTNYAARGKPYGIPGARVDGMDVEAMATEAGKAVKHVRSGKGPFVLEAMTYRYRGHSMSDPAKYRTKEEVQKYRTEQDPIERLREKLLQDGIADEAGLKGIDKEVKAIVAKSADFAQASPEPSPDELYTDITISVA